MRHIYNILRTSCVWTTLVYRKLDGKRLTPAEAWWWAHWIWNEVEK